MPLSQDLLFLSLQWRYHSHSQKYNSSKVPWIHNLDLSLVDDWLVLHPGLTSKCGFLWNGLLSRALCQSLFVSSSAPVFPRASTSSGLSLQGHFEQGCCRTLSPECNSHCLHQNSLDYLEQSSFDSLYGDLFLSLLPHTPNRTLSWLLPCKLWMLAVVGFVLQRHINSFVFFHMNFRLLKLNLYKVIPQDFEGDVFVSVTQVRENCHLKNAEFSYLLYGICLRLFRSFISFNKVL